MNAWRSAGDPPPHTPNILVVDDDRRVRELLEIALTSHGFGVVTAADGDEAVKRALGQRPDLVVLDVRLPKRSGLEVCDVLRGDPDDPSVPIILVSATSETDARLQAFARGADDYLAKPFSPKELVARIKRLLARSAEARNAQKRARELERDLTRAVEESRRARLDARREQSLREQATGLGQDLMRTLDPDALAARFLIAVQARLKATVVALLVPDSDSGRMVARAIRGDGLDRVARLAIAEDGELARVLVGLSRVVDRRELERFPELKDEIAPLVAARITLLAPLRSGAGLQGILVADERADGTESARADLDLASALCETTALALENATRFHAQVDHLLTLLADRAHPDAGIRDVHREAAKLVRGAARFALVPARHRELIAHAVALGAWGGTAEGRLALADLRRLDRTGRIAELERLWDERDLGDAAEGPCPDEARARLLVHIGLRYAAVRAQGATAEEALADAIERPAAPPDAITRRALAAAAGQANGSAEPGEPSSRPERVKPTA